MNAPDLVALAPLLAIAVTALVVMLGIAVKRNYPLAFGTAAGGILIALLALGLAGRAAPVQAGLLLRVDAYGLFFIALLLSTGLAVLGLCYDYCKNRAGDYEELPLLLLTALLGASVLVCANHFASLFLGLEILSISLFVLIGYPASQTRPLEAAIKYLLLSGVSSAFLLMGMALLYAQSGELAFAGLGRYLASQQSMPALALGGIILLVAALGFKLSVVPLHLWTPDVYQGAPAPVSAFIATVSKGAVFALLLRYFLATGGYAYPPLLDVVSALAGLSILGGNLLALLQERVKRLLAYSSIAHIGYLLVAFIAGGGPDANLSVEAASFYLVAYSIASIGAFGVVAMLSTPEAEADELACFTGLFWRRPWLAVVFTLMLLSLAGLPLTAGFIGKFYIFTSAASGRLWGLLAAVIVGSGLGLYYYLRIIVVMASDAVAPPSSERSGNLTTAILTALTVLLIVLGIFPDSLGFDLQTLAAVVK